MLKVTQENFDKIVEDLYSAATTHSSAGYYSSKGIIFNKPENRILVCNPVFMIDIRDVEIDIPVNPMTSFFDLVDGVWKEIPFKIDPFKYLEDSVNKCRFIGKTAYYGKNIMKIINLEMKKSIDQKTRYIFTHGFLADNCMCATFNLVGGEPVFEIQGFPKKFRISEHSMIPKEHVKEETYACSFEDLGDVIELNVITKHGKTRSGLIVSENYFDGRALAPINGFMDVHPELMTCSNVLEIAKDDRGEPLTMPPIHLSSITLYDCLQAFKICKESYFYLHFQEKVNQPIMLESASVHPDDPKVFIVTSPLRLDGGIKNG